MTTAQSDALQILWDSAGIPFVVFVLVAVLGSLLVMGYTMKWALAVSGVGRFGFWKSLGISTTSSVVVFLVSCAMGITMVFLKAQGPVVSMLFFFISVTAFAMVIAMVGRCGIGRGYLTYFFNSLFGTIGVIVLMIALAGILIIARPFVKLDEQDMATVRQAFEEIESTQVDLADEDSPLALDSFRNVSFSDEVSLDGESSLASDLIPSDDEPLVSSNESIQDAFYEPSTNPTKPTPSSIKPIGKPRSGVQSNPFVK